VTRILVLTNMYPPHHLGGYELSCRDVMDRLAARGHHVAVLTTTLRLPDVEDPPGERARGIARDLAFYWRDHVLQNPSIRRRVAIERHNQRALRETIDAVKPEVVSAWNMGAMSLGLLATVLQRDLPLVLNVCDEWPVYGPTVDPWTRMLLSRPQLVRSVARAIGLPAAPPDLGERATFLFVSDMIRHRVEERSAWRPKVLSVVYSGIDRTDFPASNASMDRPEWGWRVLCAGRIDERKGTHLAIEALAGLPAEATLEIIGRGDDAYLTRLRSIAEDKGLGNRVRFDSAPRAELRTRYTAADVALFIPTWEEPFGLVPVEAMACGTPVVATGAGGSSEFLRDGVNCLLVPRGDAAAAAAAVRRLAENAALRATLITGGFKTAEALDVEVLVDVLEAWHVAAAERFSRGRPPDRPKLTEMDG